MLSVLLAISVCPPQSYVSRNRSCARQTRIRCKTENRLKRLGQICPDRFDEDDALLTIVLSDQRFVMGGIRNCIALLTHWLFLGSCPVQVVNEVSVPGEC